MAFDFQKYGLQKKATVTAAGLGVLAACIYMILFSGVYRISDEAVNQQLAGFAGYVSAEAANTGKEGKFTYGPVVMEGWGFDKRAVVKNVSLELSEKALLDTNKWSISTASMTVKRDQGSKSHWLYTFAEPFNIIENSQLRTLVAFPAPVVYSFSEQAGGGKRIQSHSLKLPGQVTFSPVNNADTASHGEKPVVVTFDPNPILRVQGAPDTREYEALYKLSNVKVVSEGAGSIFIGSITSQQNDNTGQDNRVTGKYLLTLSGIVVADKDRTSKPYNLHADLAYHGDQPNMELRKLTPNFINMSFDIADLSLSNEDFHLTVTGKLSTAADDPLPYGALEMRIDHFDRFLTSELVPAMIRGNVVAAVSKVTGNTPETLATAADISFPLKREKNGVLYIGNTTFEALAASVVSSLLGTAAPVVLESPVETKPEAGTATGTEAAPSAIPVLPPPPAPITPRSNEGDGL